MRLLVHWARPHGDCGNALTVACHTTTLGIEAIRRRSQEPVERRIMALDQGLKNLKLAAPTSDGNTRSAARGPHASAQPLCEPELPGRRPLSEEIGKPDCGPGRSPTGPWLTARATAHPGLPNGTGWRTPSSVPVWLWLGHSRRRTPSADGSSAERPPRAAAVTGPVVWGTPPGDRRPRAGRRRRR